MTGLVLATGLSGCGLVGGGSGSEFCGKLRDAYPALGQEPLKVLGPDANASDWKAYFEVTHGRNQQLLAEAPQELTSALTSIQTTNDKLDEFYADAEYDPKQIDAGALAQLLDDTGYRKAVETVNAYARDTCDIETGSSPASSSG